MPTSFKVKMLMLFFFSVFSIFADEQDLLSSKLAPRALLAQATNTPELPFSSLRIAGNTVYVSGTSIPPGKSKEKNVADLTQQILESIQTLLAKEGLTLNDIVKTTVFLTNMDDFQAMNQSYAKMFAGSDSFPARTTIGVKSLPFGARIEIECIGYTEQ